MLDTGDHVADAGPRQALRRLLFWSSTPVGLGALFVAGLLLRLVLARGGGFPYDISSFAGWAQRLADGGPSGFYPAPGEDFFVDYPPGYLYVLWVLGKLAVGLSGAAPPTFALKLPPVFADLALAWLVAVLAERLAPAGRRLPVRGVAAAAILLNPAVFFVSAVWGQVDSILAVLVVGAFLLLGTGTATFRREAAGTALLAVAFVTKPQAMFVVPVVVLVLAWRHARAGPVTLGAGRAAARVAVRLAGLGAVGAAAALVLMAPFHMWPADAVSFYSRAARTYPFTSVFAFNFWGTVGFWKRDVGAEAVRFLGIPVLYVGLALFAVAATLVLVRAWRALVEGQDESRVLVFGGVAVTLVGFTTLTRIHERYLFLAVAVIAALAALRWMRWALVGLSVLFFVNVYFPYVYYVEQVGRPAPVLAGVADAFYGTDTAGARFKVLSAITAVACLGVAWLGFRRLEWSPRASGALLAAPVPVAAAAEPPPEPRPDRWTLGLHPVGRRLGLVALGIFVVTFLSRVAGLGHPPGMYFDEVYHARTGAEYLAGKEVYEWTHPPLGKEIIALSIGTLSGFGSTPASPLPDGVVPTRIGSGAPGVAWAKPGELAEVQRGVVDDACRLRPAGAPVLVDLEPDALAVARDHTFVAGVGFEGGPVLVRLDGDEEVWRVPLQGRARAVVALDDVAFVLLRDGNLLGVDPSGETEGLAAGAAAVAVSRRPGLVWASFPGERKVASWDRTRVAGTVVATSGRPGPLAAPDGADRVLVADARRDGIEVVDTNAKRVTSRIEGRAALLTSVPETGLVWTVDGRSLRVIEPRGASVIGRASLPLRPTALLADVRSHRVVALGSGEAACTTGRPTFAWRFGSAVFGAAIVALAFLLAMRLFGSVAVAGLAALFMAVEGLTFAMSRIAMIDSYGVAFILGAWFCALSVLYRWGLGPEAARSHTAALGWLFATGLVGGAAIATKWPGLYAMLGIGVLFLWDGFSRGRSSVFRLAGGFVPSLAVLAVALGALPLAVYVASYMPYLSLGHSFADLAQLQRNIFSYHSGLTASHPFGSSWYGWPFGHKAVFLYLASHDGTRSEMWSAPNVVVFLGGFGAMVALGRKALRARAGALAVVAGAAAVQYLPWMLVTRVTFLYHYLPVVPFLAIALAWWLVEHRRGRPYHREVLIGTASAAVVLFLALLPIYEGWSVPVRYLQAVRGVLPWVIP